MWHAVNALRLRRSAGVGRVSFVPDQRPPRGAKSRPCFCPRFQAVVASQLLKAKNSLPTRRPLSVDGRALERHWEEAVRGSQRSQTDCLSSFLTLRQTSSTSATGGALLARNIAAWTKGPGRSYSSRQRPQAGCTMKWMCTGCHPECDHKQTYTCSARLTVCTTCDTRFRRGPNS